MNNNHYSFWNTIWKQFLRHRLGSAGLCVVILYCLVGIYAPILASSKPLFVIFDDQWYFPLSRYLFFTGFFTKRVDVFFNLMMFTVPLGMIAIALLKKPRNVVVLLLVAHMGLFLYFAYKTPRDPAADPSLNKQRQIALQELRQKGEHRDWNFDLQYMTPYAKLNLILKNRHRKAQHERLKKYGKDLPTLWHLEMSHQNKQREQLEKTIKSYGKGDLDDNKAYQSAQIALKYLLDRRKWIDEESKKIELEIMPLVRHFHWEDDAGGDQSMNIKLPWWELTRINRKDLVSALLFGVRISLVVGILAVTFAMIIGIPIGSAAGYYGGNLDIFVCRLLEIWESMPTFFMLLLIVAITQSKSIFIVIAVVGIFGWPSFSRYIRGEFFKQRNLPYVEACYAQGFRDSHIMFSHILPNAIPPVLTLMPFAIMGAITSETGLSFLGLGEEGSCSWGVLMDEGRAAFPGESYLLWPPAILLTVLLVAIALVGDGMRDALDPKMHRE